MGDFGVILVAFGVICNELCGFGCEYTTMARQSGLRADWRTPPPPFRAQAAHQKSSETHSEEQCDSLSKCVEAGRAQKSFLGARRDTESPKIGKRLESESFFTKNRNNEKYTMTATIA